ncbi:MAG: putative alpha/beta hydrolase family esterase [Candidatus Paceibacteria bacterium]|jgi:predicted alpha/beta hydrolase family esterase
MEKKQVFYIHGGSSYSKYEDYIEDLKTQSLRSASDEDSVSKWPSTLRSELGEGYQVLMPSFPNSNNAKYEEWKIWFERHFEFLHDGVVLVCWSQGGMFIARYLSENDTPFAIRALFLLAAPLEFMLIEGMKEDGGDFYPEEAQIPGIQIKVKNITIMHSKDDFVVPYEHALKYKAALPEAELVTFEDKNHFLVEELPELVERIKVL